MMKQVNLRIPFRVLGLLMGLFLSVSAFAQEITVNGNVVDAAGEPIIGATVRVAGQAGGVVTDFDGNFQIKAAHGATLEVSYIGYQTATVTASANVNVTLSEDSEVLNEVVVIGYGTVKKTDLTGAVSALKPDSKNKGLVVSPQEMMSGKIAGVNVTSDGGTPGGSSTIRIRGGSSLNASNSPLIVIDGVAMDNNGVKGLANPLSMVNPQDIESFNVLKSASATAIYGSRGSNGVIIITTKKGRKGAAPSVSYAGNVSIGMKKKTIDVMDGDEYRAFMDQTFKGASNYDEVMGLLGTANTDWQKEIYRTAVSHDHNVTVSGSVGKVLPYRVSLGYTDQQGILKTSDFKRYTAALNLNPSLFDDHLTINLNAKGLWAKSIYADGGAINAAVAFDPTQPIKSDDPRFNNFAGYWGWLMDGSALNDNSWPYTINGLATKNPVATLELKNDRAISRSFIGSAELDYKIHGFEDLRLHATLGADISKGKQWTDLDGCNQNTPYYGSHGWETIVKRNFLLSAYAQYYHDFEDAAKNHFDLMAGYEWAHNWRTQHNNYWGLYPETNNDPTLAGQKRNETTYWYKTENYLVSFFGRANWSLMDRYYLTFTLRDDGSSRFKKHWAVFPAVAFAWKIKDEKKWQDIKWLSDLKLRLDWGMTGQQDDIGDYNYFAVYKVNTGVPGSFYDIIGDGSFVRPEPYDPNLKWETTTTYNIGLDWGLFNNRLSGSVEWYYRKTTDLLNSAYTAAGSNFKNIVMTNIGSLYNTGVEFNMNWKALQAKDWYWTIDYNFTANKNRITELRDNDPRYMVPAKDGGISAGTGGVIRYHTVGHTAGSFLVYQQVYDDNGMPIEGQVVDRNGDGQISEEDQYWYKSNVAPVTMGLASRLEYKNWDLGFSLRASIGNYVYNDFMAGNSNLSANSVYLNNYATNRPIYVLPYEWKTYDVTATHSDRWVQNASFLKMDNVTLGYSFNNIFKVGNYHGLSGRIYGSVTNVFCITKYKGIDPEVFNGIDNGVYPRPITFQLGVNLNF